MLAFLNICPILCVRFSLPEFLRGHVVKLRKFPIEESQIVVADLLCNLVNREVGVGQIKAGLAHFLQDDQLFERPSGFLFDESTEIIGMEAEVIGSALQGDGQIVFFQIIQNVHDLPLAFGLW